MTSLNEPLKHLLAFSALPSTLTKIRRRYKRDGTTLKDKGEGAKVHDASLHLAKRIILS